MTMSMSTLSVLAVSDVTLGICMQEYTLVSPSPSGCSHPCIATTKLFQLSLTKKSFHRRVDMSSYEDVPILCAIMTNKREKRNAIETSGGDSGASVAAGQTARARMCAGCGWCCRARSSTACQRLVNGGGDESGGGGESSGGGGGGGGNGGGNGGGDGVAVVTVEWGW